MRSKRILSFVSVILILATLFVSCGIGDNGELDGYDDAIVDDNADNADAACAHAETTLKNLVEASCTAKGYTGDVVCVACGAILTKGTETDYAHVWNDGEITKTATCMETGVFTYTCTLCAVTKLEAIPTVPHQDIYHDAYDGTHNHTCTMCVLNEYENHVPVDSEGTRYEATCSEPAYIRYECALCEKYYRIYSDAESDKATGHDWGDWVQTLSATCKREGKKTNECSVCHEKETVIIPVASSKHSFTESSRVPSTCTTAGSATYTCEYCTATEIRPLPLAPHDTETQTGSDGWTHSSCKDCSYEVSSFDASNVVSASVDTNNLDVNKSFEITTKDATVEFPKEVVEQMTNGSSSVKIDAGILDDGDKQAALNAATNLTEEERERLGDVDIFNFEVDTVDGNFAAKVTVKIPYVLKTGEDPDGIVIWYVGQDGTVQSIDAVYEDGYVTFEAEHFSYYAVAYVETQEMMCRRGHHDYQATTVKVNTSCTGYGYTLYECSCCHITDVRDVVAKLDHAYGELVAPTVTCDEGGYWSKTCSNCGDVKNFTYVRATGHTITKRATCEEDSICTTCGHVAEFAHGHNYSEWKTVKEPTDVIAGLRRRNCTTCGGTEEMVIAATGNIEQYGFTDYQEVFEFILSDILHFENGTVTFEAECDGTKYTIDMTLEKENNSYLMFLDCVESYYNNGELKENEYKYFYRDGVMVYANGYYEEGAVSHINAYNANMPFDVLMDCIELVFDYYAPALEGSFDEISALLEVLDLFVAPEINEIFEEFEIDMTISDLSDIFGKLRILYAYNAQKLGFKTGIAIDADVPTVKDLLEVLSDYATVTDGTDGQKIYTIDFEQITDAVEAVIDWLEENEDERLSNVVYEILSDEITDIYPDVKSWDDLVRTLKSEYTENMKLGKAIDKLISVLETRNVIEINEFYKLLESLTFEMTGRRIDIKDYIMQESGSATFGEFVREVWGYKNLDEFWKYLDKEFKENYLGDGFDVDKIRADFNELTQDTDFKLTVDEFGYIIDLNVNGEYAYDGDEASFNIAVKQDESVTVEVPAELEKLLGTKITTSIKSNGDLVVTVPEGYDYELKILGSQNIPLENLIERDSTISAQFGYDVYVLKQQYWNNTAHIGEYLEVGGKYYTYSEEYKDSTYEIVDTMSFADIQADWTSILPENGATPDGVLYDDKSINVYENALGCVYQQDGAWYFATDYSRYSYTDEAGSNNTNTSTYRYDIYDAYLASEVLDGVKVSNSNDSMYSDKTYDYNGQKIEVMRMYISFNGIKETKQVKFYIDDNGNIILLEMARGESKTVYRLGVELSVLPECDMQERYEYTSKYAEVVDKNGNKVEGKIYKVSQYVYYPEYYVKVDNGVYVSMSTDKNNGEFEVSASDGMRKYINTTGKEEITLPSGKKMYVVEKRGNLVYGYTKISANLFVQTACRYEGDTITEVIYRYQRTTEYVRLDDYVDIDRYTTKNGTTYTISADAIALLKDVCYDEGDSFAIYAEAVTDVNGMEYTLNHMAYSYMVPFESYFGGRYQDSAMDFDWYSVFGSSSSDTPGYLVTPNKDGSITVTSDGSSVTVNYEYDYRDYNVTSGMVKYDSVLSSEYGMDVYKLPNSDTNYVVCKDGKYYYYDSDPIIKYEYTTNVKTLIADYWKISNLYYGYDTEIDGETVPVYSGNVYFGKGYYGGYSDEDMYFAIKGGKMYVLAGAEPLGNSVIKYEELIVINDYFDALSEYVVIRGDGGVVDNFRDESLNIHQLYNVYVSIECDDELYNASHSFSVKYVVVNGQKRYITFSESKDSYLNIGEEAKYDEIIGVVDEWTTNYANGKFEMKEIRYAEYEYVVKIIGKYYDFHDYINYYRVSYEDVIDDLCDYEWVYGVEKNGVISYYKSVEYNGDYVVLSQPLSSITILEEDNCYYIGRTAEGYDVYEYCRYLVEDLGRDVLADGSVYLYDIDYPDHGYVSCKDGYYIEAYKETDYSTQTQTVCTYMSSVTIYGESITGIWSEYVTVNGSSVAISSNILNAIPENARDSFKIRIRTSGTDSYYAFTMDYEDLSGWLEIAKNQNASSEYYVWNYNMDKYVPA